MKLVTPQPIKITKTHFKALTETYIMVEYTNAHSLTEYEIARSTAAESTTAPTGDSTTGEYISAPSTRGKSMYMYMYS